jgi:hypothetical protein
MSSAATTSERTSTSRGTTSARATAVAPLLQQARSSLQSARTLLDDAEPEDSEAVSLLASVTDILKMATSVKLSLTASISTSGACRESGHRNAATLLSELEGVPIGAANATVATANRLKECPAADDAMRNGELSEAQAKLITSAAILAPDREGDLVDAARKKSLAELADDCRRTRATSAKADPEATYRRIHESRSVRSWTDEEGGVNLQGRFTPDVGAKVTAALHAVANELFEEARRTGSREPLQAYQADALAGLVLGERTPVHPGVDIHVRVDHEALLRGFVVDGELSEVDGVGPLPVPKVRDLLGDAKVKVIFAHGDDVSRIYHFTRTINSVLATALMERDPVCVVPGCGARRFLEIDHVHDFALGGPTTLSNLARICSFHHSQKSDYGYRLYRGDDGSWRFDPPAPFGEEPEPGGTSPPG